MCHQFADYVESMKKPSAIQFLCEHSPKRELEKDGIKILCDFPIQTDHHLEHNKPDIIVHDIRKRECAIIGIACSFDSRVDKKELDRYQDLK